MVSRALLGPVLLCFTSCCNFITKLKSSRLFAELYLHRCVLDKHRCCFHLSLGHRFQQANLTSMQIDFSFSFVCKAEEKKISSILWDSGEQLLLISLPPFCFGSLLVCAERTGPLNNVVPCLQLGSIAQVQPTDICTHRHTHACRNTNTRGIQNGNIHTRPHTRTHASKHAHWSGVGVC